MNPKCVCLVCMNRDVSSGCKRLNAEIWGDVWSMTDFRFLCGYIKICPNTSYPSTRVLLRFDKRLYDSSTTTEAKKKQKTYVPGDWTYHYRRTAMACASNIKFLVDFPSEKLIKVSSQNSLPWEFPLAMELHKYIRDSGHDLRKYRHT